MDYVHLLIICFLASGGADVMDCDEENWKLLQFGYDVSLTCRLGLDQFYDCDSLNEYIDGLYTIGNNFDYVWSGSWKDNNGSVPIIRSNSSYSSGMNSEEDWILEDWCSVRTLVDITVLYRRHEVNTGVETSVIAGLHERSMFSLVDINESDEILGEVREIFITQRIVFRLAQPKSTESRFMAEVVLSPVGSSYSWRGLFDGLSNRPGSSLLQLLALSAILFAALLGDYI